MFDFKFISPKTIKDAWLAGYDYEKNGAKIENYHSSFFTKLELKAAWEKGKKAAKWEKS